MKDFYNTDRLPNNQYFIVTVHSFFYYIYNICTSYDV